MLHSSDLWVNHYEQTMLPCAVVHLIQTGTIVVGADAVRCLCLCICCEKILLFVLLRYEYCLLRVDHAHYEVLVYSRTSYIVRIFELHRVAYVGERQRSHDRVKKCYDYDSVMKPMP